MGYCVENCGKKKIPLAGENLSTFFPELVHGVVLFFF
jgi:hypothetical protein